MYQRRYSRNKKLSLKSRLNQKNILAIFVLICIFILIYFVDLSIHSEKIYPNVIAMNQEIGNMTREQACQILNPIALKMISKPMIIKYHDFEINMVPREKLGASIDVTKIVNSAYSIGRAGTFLRRLRDRISLKSHTFYISNSLELDQKKFEEFFIQIQSQIEELPRNATLEANRITPSQQGILIDRSKLTGEIQQAVIDSVNVDTPEKINVPVFHPQPDLLTNELLASIGVQPEISSFETSLQGKSKNTLYNIQKASERIHGIILKPGENFSFNYIVGPAEKEDGYKESTIIANGQLINGYGGGICQVSTTLYNAALLAGLQIIERYHHSIYGDATNYVPLGKDSAIYYGSKDLKFKNSIDQKIILFSEVKDNNLKVTILGEEALNKDITIISQDKEIHDYDIIEIKQENGNYFENRIIQEGIPGYSIKTYRRIADLQEEKLEFLSEDHYISVPMKILVD